MKKKIAELNKKLFLYLSLVGLVVSSSFAIAQNRLAIEEVKDGLHMITGPGGNIGVRVTSEGVILIDDKFPQDFDEIQSLVATVSNLPVRYVVNTHHHGDHSGSNPGFLPIAEVIAHKNARENMIRGNQDGLPRVVYSNETSVFLGGIEVQVFHLGRGHTNGDSVVYFPDLKTVHGGDLLHGIAPFIDYGNGGTSRGWVSAQGRGRGSRPSSPNHRPERPRRWASPTAPTQKIKPNRKKRSASLNYFVLITA